MKFRILFILSIVIFLSLQSCKSYNNLYLYFDNNSKYMNKIRMGENSPFNYGFKLNKNIELNLTSDLFSQYSPTKIDTFHIKYLDSIKLKDYNWLNNFTQKFEHPDFIKFSEHFKAVYIVEVDSVKQEVIVSKVQSVNYED